MDDDDIEHLITAIKSNEAIWNLNHQHYKNLKKKANAWRAVAGQCRISVPVAKKKWKGLRDSYTRELHRNLTKGLDNGAFKWKFTEHMNFLRVHLRTRNTSKTDYDFDDDTQTTTISISRIKQNRSPTFTYIDEYASSMPAAELEFSNSSVDNSQRDILFVDSGQNNKNYAKSSLKKAKLDLETSLLNSLECVKDLLGKPLENPLIRVPSTLNHEDELFCRSMMEKISKFPLRLKNEAKLKFMEYLCKMEAELEKE